MGENGILVSPSFLWKEVPRRGAEVGSRYALKGMCGISRAPSPHSAFLTANGKDFSLTLEMTIRESDVS